MALITATTDFVGKYKISQDNFSATELQSYLDKYEPIYLNKLMGAELYALFVTDYNSAPANQPTAARFVAMFDAFQTDDGNLLYISEGIEEMLLGILYFEFVRDLPFKVQVSGTSKPVKSISSNAQAYEAGLYNRFNRGVDTYCAIQWLIDDSTDYPEENMQPLSKTFGL